MESNKRTSSCGRTEKEKVGAGPGASGPREIVNGLDGKVILNVSRLRLDGNWIYTVDHNIANSGR